MICNKEKSMKKLEKQILVLNRHSQLYRFNSKYIYYFFKLQQLNSITQMHENHKLNLSGNVINNSSSKQKFSFSKSQRFRSPRKIVCDSFYELPTTRTRRSTSFGYGYKNLGIKFNKDVAPVGTYQLPSDFKHDTRRGFGFGKGREQMEITGPLRESMMKQYLPGPGTYPIRSSLEHPNITLKSRLPDHALEHLQNLPGPGTYEFEQLGSARYYVASKHPNLTNRKFSQSRRSQSFVTKSSNLGPNAYDISVTDINPDGRYILSKQQNSRVRQFGKEPRKDMVYKHMITTPGPGRYQPFSDFGRMI